MHKIQITNLTKKFGETLALDDVTISLEENKIYGLLGRNGAGKTTLLNLLTNKIFPTSGSISIDGGSVLENDKVLRKIYYMTEETLHPGSLKVKDVFYWTKQFYPKFDQEYALKLARRFELDLYKKVKTLSTGFRSIFKAILTLSSGADILIFDEPVLGLDANHRELLYKEILANYIKEEKTIIISTHLIDEIADILEEVLIIKEGKIILKQQVEDLLAEAYTVSGEIRKVDQYLNGKTCVSAEILQNFKSATIYGEQPNRSLAKSLDLDLGKAELQKLFIGITNTNSGEV